MEWLKLNVVYDAEKMLSSEYWVSPDMLKPFVFKHKDHEGKNIVCISTNIGNLSIEGDLEFAKKLIETHHKGDEDRHEKMHESALQANKDLVLVLEKLLSRLK